MLEKLKREGKFDNQEDSGTIRRLDDMMHLNQLIVGVGGSTIYLHMANTAQQGKGPWGDHDGGIDANYWTDTLLLQMDFPPVKWLLTSTKHKHEFFSPQLQSSLYQRASRAPSSRYLL